MTNPGGIRTDLLFAQISGGELPGQVTFAEAFAVQPFSNSLVTMTLTGAQLKAVLEQQATAGSDGSGRMLQISYSLTYTWTTSAPVGSKVSNLQDQWCGGRSRCQLPCHGQQLPGRRWGWLHGVDGWHRFVERDVRRGRVRELLNGELARRTRTNEPNHSKSINFTHQ